VKGDANDLKLVIEQKNRCGLGDALNIEALHRFISQNNGTTHDNTQVVVVIQKV
jgi:hypothetical protein